MDDRMISSPAMGDQDSESMGHGQDIEQDENEDEKIYYGFGVFMGLPLADLRAMKEEYLQREAAAGGGAVRQHNGNGMADAGGRMQHARMMGGPPTAYQDYDVADHPRGPRGGLDSVSPSQREYSNGMRREYDRELDRGMQRTDSNGSNDDEMEPGPDGSYDTRTSHSLNFILH